MEFVSYDIASNDFRRAGAASHSIKEHLKRIGADAEAIRRTMIAAYEAEMNVVIHAHGGRLEASLSDTQIDVNVIDGGPGITDIELAMSEGFSTASVEARSLGFGAGLGLPNIRRNSDRLRVTSRVDEGTRVSFTVYLRPETTLAQRMVSLYASPERCNECGSCLAVCPTRATRVRVGRPSILEHLCVDCTACIGACAPQALTIRDEVSSLEDVVDRTDMVLAVPPAILAGCGPSYPPALVLPALETLGFAEVVSVAPFEQALRGAVMAAADARAPTGATPVAEPLTAAAMGVSARPDEGEPVGPLGSEGLGPLIAPSCPAVVNLIELRFPSLVPQLAPFESPWEALQATYADRPVAYVVSCPSQRSALLAHNHKGGHRPADHQKHHSHRASAPERAEYLTPELIRQAVMVRLTGQGNGGTSPEDGNSTSEGVAAGRADAGGPHDMGEVGADAGDRLLTVTGMSHVIRVLEEAEDGLLDDLAVIDPYACEGGCFGSPLLFEDHHVTRRRWDSGRMEVEAAEDARGEGPVTRLAVATPRRRAYSPRPGIRLDPDMSRAIEKLGHMQAVIHSLPGRDCGACGAPTCAALAEDVVMGRADVDLCPYAGGGKEGQDT